MIDPSFVEQLLKTAHTAAWRAGQVVREGYARPHNVRQKKGPRDLVTETDGAAQAAALAVIQERYSDHAILAEEDPRAQPDQNGVWAIPSGVTWAIDPLDGTTNYTTALPFLCVSVGAAIDGQPVVGVIYDPLREEMFTGGYGLAVTLNGQPVEPLKPVALVEAMAGVDWTPIPTTRDRIVSSVFTLSRQCRTVRALGSAALAMAYIACQRVQLYLNYGLQPWDTCAAAAIVQAAGGEVWRVNGSRWQFGEPAVLVGHPEVLAAAVRVLAEG